MTVMSVGPGAKRVRILNVWLSKCKEFQRFSTVLAGFLVIRQFLAYFDYKPLSIGLSIGQRMSLNSTVIHPICV